MEEYHEIVKKQMEEVFLKKSKLKDEKEIKYLEWVLGQLMEDLKDFETGGRQRWGMW